MKAQLDMIKCRILCEKSLYYMCPHPQYPHNIMNNLNASFKSISCEAGNDILPAIYQKYQFSRFRVNAKGFFLLYHSIALRTLMHSPLGVCCKLYSINKYLHRDSTVLSDCMILYSLGMAQTTQSFTRQSKIDVLKRQVQGISLVA